MNIPGRGLRAHEQCFRLPLSHYGGREHANAVKGTQR
jgi:hypothetical protein